MRSDITHSVVSVGSSALHIHIFHSLFWSGRVFLGAPSVTVVKIDGDVVKSIPNCQRCGTFFLNKGNLKELNLLEQFLVTSGAVLGLL